MINKQRVRRIKNVIYAVIFLLMLLPFVLLFTVAYRANSVLANLQDTVNRLGGQASYSSPADQPASQLSGADETSRPEDPVSNPADTPAPAGTSTPSTPDADTTGLSPDPAQDSPTPSDAVVSQPGTDPADTPEIQATYPDPQVQQASPDDAGTEQAGQGAGVANDDENKYNYDDRYDINPSGGR